MLTAALLATTAAIALQQDAPPPQERQQVADGLYVITGQGGNILFSTGQDGTFVVDDQFARVAQENMALIEEVSDGPIVFVLNTHYHGDHTGANQDFYDAGATIISREAVRRRLEESDTDGQGASEPSGEDALPQITFNDQTSFYWNGQPIRAVALPDAHTDGDAMVYFEDADVLHTGDVFFAGRYPYIDVEGGGSAAGMIAGLERILDVAGPDTTVVPGHGPVTDEAGVREALEMLREARDLVAERVAAGDSREEVVRSDVLDGFTERFASDFVDTDRMEGQLYDSITQGGPATDRQRSMVQRLRDATLKAREGADAAVDRMRRD